MTELLLRITARLNGMAPMVQSLAKVMFQAKLEPACTDCRLYSENGKPQSLLYVERWATARDFEVQLRSERFGTLLAIMESAPQPPELEVRTVSEQRGLDYVSRIRLAPPGMASTETEHAIEFNDSPRQQRHAPRINT